MNLKALQQFTNQIFGRDWHTVIDYEQFDDYGMCEGCEKFDCINKYKECERCCDDVQVTK
jgi:hypothetical protein